MPRWFITGTDTDAGKTYVTSALAAAFRALDFDTLALKPLMSGFEPNHPESDSVRIANAAGHAPKVFAWWETPVSPHRAAWIENKPLDINGLRRWLAEHQAAQTLVEGVGGWRVPLSMSETGDVHYAVRDLAKDVNGDIIVVAPNRLGILNQVQLTVEAIQRDGLSVRGVVLNQLQTRSTSVAEKTNLDDLEKLLSVPTTTFPVINELEPAVLATAGRSILDAFTLT